MRPQVFENQSGRWFVEPKLECPFFNDARIGRSLARLDWNNDGREDLAAGLLDSPYVMLTNTSTPAGCWLGLHLVGTTSSRNAIGAVVTVRDGDNSLTQQLASGSGFQASNQRRIVVAIPGKTQEKFVQITVRWQNGDEVVFHEVATNQSYIVVQPRPGTSRPQVPFLLPL